jgi:hypothetical protein
MADAYDVLYGNPNEEWDPEREIEEELAQKAITRRAYGETAERGRLRLLGKQSAALAAKKAREGKLAKTLIEEKIGISKESPVGEKIKKMSGLARKRKTKKRHGKKVRKTRRSKSRK